MVDMNMTGTQAPAVNAAPPTHEVKQEAQPDVEEQFISLPKPAFAERLARAKKTAETELLNKLRSEGKLIEDAATDSETVTDPAANKTAPRKNAELDKYKSVADTKIKELEDKLNKQALNQTLMTSLSRHKIREGAMQDVVAILSSRQDIRVDNGEVRIVEQDGSVRYNNQMLPMTTDDLVTDWLREHDWYVASQVKSGSGSSNTPGQYKLPGQLTVENYEQHRNDPEFRRAAQKQLGMGTLGVSGNPFAKQPTKAV